jgi:hypothetical protein
LVAWQKAINMLLLRSKAGESTIRDSDIADTALIHTVALAPHFPLCC